MKLLGSTREAIAQFSTLGLPTETEWARDKSCGNAPGCDADVLSVLRSSAVRPSPMVKNGLPPFPLTDAAVSELNDPINFSNHPHIVRDN